MTRTRPDPDPFPLTELQRELIMTVGRGSRVLQVGEVDGVSRALELRDCLVTVVESEKFSDLLEAGEAPGGGSQDEHIDVVLFLEPFEQAASAERLLNVVRVTLPRAGEVVASFRNVAHGGTRLALLCGTLPTGDEEQLGGFTRDGASRLFARSGWSILGCRGVEADPLGSVEDALFPDFLLDAVRRDPDARPLHYVVRAARDAPGHIDDGADALAASPVLDALAEVEDARRRLALLSPRTFFVARRLQGLLVRALPPGSRRRALAQGAIRLAGRLLLRRPPPAPAGPEPVTREPLIGDLGAELQEFLSDPARRLVLPRTGPPLLSVLVVTYNKPEHTLRCLSAIAKEADDVPLEVIIVDNASEDDTHQLLDRLDGVTCIRNDENRHFLRGTNQGAEQATGRYLLLLNNDAYVRPGALRALVDVAESEVDVGAVGAKLVWPDGRLQEAGSILWRDGSAMGYGRGDDPEHPRYRYRREVDYCSAACLLVRRDLFEAVGGFDARYAPAYYEDADLCMSAWSRGLRVLYEPKAVVVHNEYTSSDRGRATDLMRRNHGRFGEKWRDALASRPARDEDGAVLRARDRRPGPPMLVIDDRVPSPGYGAGSPRMSVLVRFLAEEGYRVTFVPMYFSELPQPETSRLEAAGVEVLERPRTGVDVADVRRLLEERPGFYETVFVSRPHSAVLVIPIVRELAPEAEIVYDAEALFYRRKQAQADLHGRGDLKGIRKMRDLEARLIEASDKAISVAEGEARLMRELTVNDAIFVWGHATATRPTERPFPLRSDLLFVGTFDRNWRTPNEQGIREFVEYVLPRVADQLDRVRLRIVGRNAVEAVSDLAGPFVRVDGFVEDLDAVYDACRVFVNPVRAAAGIPLKLTEAMSRGVPAVTSCVGAQSLGLTEGEQALTAESPDEFARKVVALYTDEELWTKLREGAVRWVGERCDPDRLRSELRGILDAPPSSAASEYTRVRKKDVYAFPLCRMRLPRSLWRSRL